VRLAGERPSRRESRLGENAGIVTYGEKEIANEVRAEWLWRRDIGVAAF